MIAETASTAGRGAPARDGGPAPVVSCTGMSKSFGATRAVDAVDLDVHAGELLALLGPSGCGKTTTLRLIAGFERLDAGRIVLDGVEVAGPGRFVAAERRRVGVVFQDFALFPHLNVARNVGYGVRDRERRATRVAEMLELVGLTGVARRYPHELSGGQQQRVALARALAPEPAIVLLDEPFSNLDAALRARVRREVRAILRDAGATAVIVTHDQEEALALADRIAVMRDGRLVQVGTPGELYARPAEVFVAAFVGDADVVPATVGGDGAIHHPLLGALQPLDVLPAGPCEVVVRPERVRLHLDGTGHAVVRDATFFGHDQLVEVRLDDGTILRARLGPTRAFQSGDRVAVAIAGPVVAFSSAW